MKRKPRYMPPPRERNDYREPPSDYRESPSDYREPSSKGDSKNFFNLAVIGAVLVLGIVLGSILTYNVNFSTESLTTDVEIAKLAPNPELCAQYGASAIVTETRTFVTLNPRRVFVSQPQTQPGCVLRSSNWSVLRQKDAINGEEVSACRNRMNTFGYTGDIDVPETAEVNCLYQNDGQTRF
ncbi:MAG: DUF3172 domain-containing protein [Leptolyngbya sp. SIO4C1]|nr:DUF3172 domain-containing protein [Leptolyngbya sp. SIO4C1]